MPEEMRTCKKCGKSKPLSEFYPYKSVRGNQIIKRLPYTCKTCDIAKSMRYHKQNMERLKGQRRQWVIIDDSPEAKALRGLNRLFKSFDPKPFRSKQRRRGPYQRECYPYRGFRLKKFWAFPLEERGMRNLRYLLDQYGLTIPRPELKFVTVPVADKIVYHLLGDKMGVEIRGALRKRTLCGVLITSNIVIVGPEDVTCKMCKKLSDKGA